MNSQTYPQTLTSTKPNHGSFLLYKNFGAIEPGLSFGLRMGSEIGLDVGCPEHHAWLHQLDLPAEASDLMRRAVESSYLILALGDGPRLSEAAREWVHEWLNSVPIDSSALIVLFGPDHGETWQATATREDLDHMAAQGGVNCFFFSTEPAQAKVDADAEDLSDAIPEIDVAEEDDPAEWFVGAINAFGERGEGLMGAA